MVSEGVVVVARGTVVQTVPLQVPLNIATGRYEHLTDYELADILTDLIAEVRRRNGTIKTTPDKEDGWTWQLELPDPR